MTARRAGEESRLRALKAALAHLRAGRFADAAAAAEAALAAAPDDAEALHLLALAAHGRGEKARARELLAQAIARAPGEARFHTNLGRMLHEDGRLAEAAASHRRALALRPDYAEALANLAGVLADQGDLAAAAECCRRALALAPERAETLYTLGAIEQERGQAREAAALYRRAVALRPDLAEAHNNLGTALLALGQTRAAAESYRRALALRPGLAGFHANLAGVLARLGARGPALAHLRKAVALEPGEARYWHALGRAIRALPAAEARALAKPELIAALDHRAVDPRDVAPAAAAALAREPRLAAWFALAGGADRAGAAGAARAHLRDDAGACAALADPLLLRLLVTAIVPDPSFERLLACLRRAFLALHEAGERPKAPCLGALAALAAYVGACDHVLAEGEAEVAAAARLSAEIEGALAAEAPITAESLALLAAYRPLGALAGADRLLEREWPEPVSALLACAVGEPLAEAALAAGIPRLTPIADPVSRAVRAQYESNPYPRWVRAPFIERPLPLAALIAALSPANRARGYGAGAAAPEVLVAGCGTGRHAVLTAMRLEGARVLALDLSLASLAFAARKARELGLSNLAFAQADLLAFGDWPRRFEAIEAVGVLHHLAEPERGLRLLAGLLKPRGVMLVGLYSACARRHVAAARERLARAGLAPDLAGIRRAREMLIEEGPAELRAELLASPDFYSASGCRDLLFHVQEQAFTLARVAAMIADAGLEFLGFEHSEPSLIERYRASFPDDADALSLADWERFEADNPDTFGAMYVFWLGRAG